MEVGHRVEALADWIEENLSAIMNTLRARESDS
jgi:hypothetical protein